MVPFSTTSKNIKNASVLYLHRIKLEGLKRSLGNNPSGRVQTHDEEDFLADKISWKTTPS